MAEELKVSVSTIRERLFLERMRLLHPGKVDAFQAMKSKAKSKYLDDNWCKLFPPVDAALRKIVTAPMQRLVSKGMNAEADEMMRAHWEPQIKAKLHNTYEFYIIMMRYSSHLSERNAEEQSRLLLTYYLLLVEGVYSAQVNILCYLLTNSGPAYKSSKTMAEHASSNGSMGMIEEDSLWNKLRFLEDNGLYFFVEACDRQLRNSVAHLDFIVFTNGCVGYGASQRGPKVISYDDLVHKVEVLKSISDAVNEVLADETGKWRKTSKTPRSKAPKPKAKMKAEAVKEKDPKEILRRVAQKGPKPKEEDQEMRL